MCIVCSVCVVVACWMVCVACVVRGGVLFDRALCWLCIVCCGLHVTLWLFVVLVMCVMLLCVCDCCVCVV